MSNGHMYNRGNLAEQAATKLLPLAFYFSSYQIPVLSHSAGCVLEAAFISRFLSLRGSYLPEGCCANELNVDFQHENYTFFAICRGDQEKIKCLETDIKHLFLEKNRVNKTNSALIFQKKGLLKVHFSNKKKHGNTAKTRVFRL